MELQKTAGLLAFLLVSAVLLSFVNAETPQTTEGIPMEIDTLSSDCMSTREEGVQRTEKIENGTRIEGVFQTPNPCHTINVSTVQQNEDTYTIDLVAEPQEGICVQCVGSITYEIILEDDEPDKVIILHDGEKVDVVEFNPGESRSIIGMLIDWLGFLF